MNQALTSVISPGLLLAFPPPLPPGSFVKLNKHPHDLPAFELIRCEGRRCWVRQQSWGRNIQWEVSRRSLLSDAG
jgi:hypothetical protein